MESNLDNKEKRNVVDIDFHLRLVEIAGNQFMLQVMQLIRRPILFHMIASLEMDAAVHSHWDIVQAIKDRDEKKAAELIHQHCLRGYKLASYYMIGTGQSFTPSAVRSVREKRG
jgi:DNA-binding GntR family transcriptional regulator